MSKKVPVYLSKEELEELLHGLSELHKKNCITKLNCKLKERLEFELNTLEEEE